jgi:hypothetical protein
MSIKRYQKPLAILTVLCLLVTGLTYTTYPSAFPTVFTDGSLSHFPQLGGSSLSHDCAILEPQSPPQPRFKHPILLLQYDCQCRLVYHGADDHAALLKNLSARQHQEYADAHGYVYRLTTGQYVPREDWPGSNYMNKVFITLQVILEELGRDDRVEWVM